VSVIYLSAVPAYGRNYGTEKQVREAWTEGKDFLIQDPIIGERYINKDDLPDDTQLNIRYCNMTRVCVIKAVSAKVFPAASGMDDQALRDNGIRG
jgi:hypothetical protein